MVVLDDSFVCQLESEFITFRIRNVYNQLLLETVLILCWKPQSRRQPLSQLPRETWTFCFTPLFTLLQTGEDETVYYSNTSIPPYFLPSLCVEGYEELIIAELRNFFSHIRSFFTVDTVDYFSLLHCCVGVRLSPTYFFCLWTTFIPVTYRAHRNAWNHLCM